MQYIIPLQNILRTSFSKFQGNLLSFSFFFGTVNYSFELLVNLFLFCVWLRLTNPTPGTDILHHVFQWETWVTCVCLWLRVYARKYAKKYVQYEREKKIIKNIYASKYVHVWVSIRKCVGWAKMRRMGITSEFMLWKQLSGLFCECDNSHYLFIGSVFTWADTFSSFSVTIFSSFCGSMASSIRLHL